MGKFHDSIKPPHREFIEKQHLFFVATAPLSAGVNTNTMLSMNLLISSVA